MYDPSNWTMAQVSLSFLTLTMPSSPVGMGSIGAAVVVTSDGVVVGFVVSGTGRVVSADGAVVVSTGTAPVVTSLAAVVVSVPFWARAKPNKKSNFISKNFVFSVLHRSIVVQKVAVSVLNAKTQTFSLI